MTRPTYAPRAAGLSACLLAALLLAGCGGHTAATTKPASSASPSASPTTSSPPSPTRPAAPAGKSVVIGKASLVVPASWDVTPTGAGFLGFSDPPGNIICNLGQTPGLTEKRATKAVISRLAKDDLPKSEGRTHRDPDLIVNGVRIYHVEWRDPGVTYNDDLATVNDGYLISVDCRSGIGMAPRRWSVNQIAKFMATFRLR